MAGPDLSQISSNWKILQERLKAGKRQEQKVAAISNGNKRKRSDTTDKKAATAVKKSRFSISDANNTAVARKKSTPPRMGSSSSTPAATTAQKTSRLIHDHDIAPADISAAYGTHSQQTTSHDDEINIGHHPTHKPGKFLSLDCEMVGTGPPPHTDNLLARASLVNFHGQQIYDSYVLPPPGMKVQDYRTHVSGIQPHHMRAPFARSFQEVQRDVADLLDARILVGHALRNDLNVLMLTHPKRDLRDTSRYAKYRVESRGKPPALRKLAKSELGLVIQTGEHSSLEDARAAMALFKKEKVGFEAENRKTFGQARRVKGGAKEEVKDDGDSEVEDDVVESDGDLDLIDGEEDDEFADELPVTERIGAGGAGAGTKKKKKKKRTKRK
jgi:RNA exonuclease 4